MKFVFIVIIAFSFFSCDGNDNPELDFPEPSKESIEASEWWDKALASTDPNFQIMAYSKVLSLVPDYNSGTFLNRGNAYIKIEDYDAALSDYNKALEIQPNFVLAYVNRSSVYYRLKNFHAAINDCNKALSIDPSDADAYWRRGLSKLRLGMDDYCDDFRIACKLGEDTGCNYLESNFCNN